jgi:hypothetical protein
VPMSSASAPRAEAARSLGCRRSQAGTVCSDACDIIHAGRTYLSVNTNVVLPGDTEEEGLEPGAFISTVEVGFADKDADKEEDQRFFCSRMGSVLVACGDTFRLSACLPGAAEPPPDVPHLYSLHKARCYSPATGSMVLGGSKSLKGLRLVQKLSC